MQCHLEQILPSSLPPHLQQLAALREVSQLGVAQQPDLVGLAWKRQYGAEPGSQGWELLTMQVSKGLFLGAKVGHESQSQRGGSLGESLHQTLL